MTLNFDLSSHLMFVFRGNNLFDIHNFESLNKFRSLLSSQINMTKLTSAHWFSKFKIVNWPIRRIINFPWLLGSKLVKLWITIVFSFYLFTFIFFSLSICVYIFFVFNILNTLLFIFVFAFFQYLLRLSLNPMYA